MGENHKVAGLHANSGTDIHFYVFNSEKKGALVCCCFSVCGLQ